jgi:hypothetical protein
MLSERILEPRYSSPVSRLPQERKGQKLISTGILQHWRASEGVVSDRILYGSVFTLAIGSNFGAYSFVYVSSSFNRGAITQNADIQLLSLFGWPVMEEHSTSEGVGDFAKGVYQVEYSAVDCHCLGWMFGRCGRGLRHV